MIMIPNHNNKSPNVATAISVGAVRYVQRPGEIPEDVFWLTHNFNIFIYLLFLLGSGVSWTRSQGSKKRGLFPWEHMQNLKNLQITVNMVNIIKVEENNTD